MPSDVCLQTLLRKEPLSVEEWAALLEDARRQIKPFLKVVTLPRLGQLEWCTFDRRYLEQDSPRTLGAGLTTQGIFGVEGFSNAKLTQVDGFDPGGSVSPHTSIGTIQAWGLCRHGTWIISTVTFQTERGGSSRNVATSVTTTAENARSMLKKLNVHPHMILDDLRGTINGWVRHKQTQLEMLQHAEAELRGIVEMTRGFFEPQVLRF